MRGSVVALWIPLMVALVALGLLAAAFVDVWPWGTPRVLGYALSHDLCWWLSGVLALAGVALVFVLPRSFQAQAPGRRNLLLDVQRVLAVVLVALTLFDAGALFVFYCVHNAFMAEYISAIQALCLLVIAIAVCFLGFRAWPAAALALVKRWRAFFVGMRRALVVATGGVVLAMVVVHQSVWYDASDQLRPDTLAESFDFAVGTMTSLGFRAEVEYGKRPRTCDDSPARPGQRTQINRLSAFATRGEKSARLYFAVDGFSYGYCENLVVYVLPPPNAKAPVTNVLPSGSAIDNVLDHSAIPGRLKGLPMDRVLVWTTRDMNLGHGEHVDSATGWRWYDGESVAVPDRGVSACGPAGCEARIPIPLDWYEHGAQVWAQATNCRSPSDSQFVPDDVPLALTKYCTGTCVDASRPDAKVNAKVPSIDGRFDDAEWPWKTHGASSSCSAGVRYQCETCDPVRQMWAANALALVAAVLWAVFVSILVGFFLEIRGRDDGYRRGFARLLRQVQLISRGRDGVARGVDKSRGVSRRRPTTSRPPRGDGRKKYRAARSSVNALAVSAKSATDIAGGALEFGQKLKDPYSEIHQVDEVIEAVRRGFEAKEWGHHAAEIRARITETMSAQASSFWASASDILSAARAATTKQIADLEIEKASSAALDGVTEAIRASARECVDLVVDHLQNELDGATQGARQSAQVLIDKMTDTTSEGD